MDDLIARELRHDLTIIRKHAVELLQQNKEAAARIEALEARWASLTTLVMTDHRGDGLPTQEVTPDELIAFIERVIAERDAAVAAERVARARGDDHARNASRLARIVAAMPSELTAAAIRGEEG